ncbi:MAG: universal stress protein [bacterium]|nr:universal stress protein [bacterium]
MDSLKNIVVGVDFSAFSQSALAQALRIARWNDAKLHVLHGVDLSAASAVRDALLIERASSEPGDPCDEVCDSALKQLEDLIALSEPGEVEVLADAVLGSPFVEILRRVRDAPADLLVLGSNGSSDPARGAGVLATKCVRKAATKVLLVRELHVKQFNCVVACVDFSETSHRVVEQAIRVAQQDRASLHLLHVGVPPWEVLSYIRPPSAEAKQQYNSSLHERLRQVLQCFEIETSGLGVELHVVEGKRDADGIIQFVERSAADLVVVGTRGRTGLRAILLGTIAERIVRESPCSVLAVKPEGFTYDVN